MTTAIAELGSFCNDQGDGNENGKNAIGLIRKTTTFHVYHTFLHTSFGRHCTTTTFYEGRKQATTNSF